MARSSILLLPKSVLDRPAPTTTRSKATLEGFPDELLFQTLRYTDLFTRINIARCSTTLAAFVNTWLLLHFDPYHLSAAESALLLDSVPIEMRVAELKREYTETNRYADDDFLNDSDMDSGTDSDTGNDTSSDEDDDNDDDSDNNTDHSDAESSPHLVYDVEIHPARLHCKVCNFRCLLRVFYQQPGAFRTAWVRHVRMEVLRTGGRVPKPKLYFPDCVRSAVACGGL